MNNLSIVGKDQKKVVAKALMDLNYSATEISDLLQIDRSTVYRYSKQPTPEELQQFATEIKTILNMKQYQIIAKVLKRIEFLVEKSLDLRTLINAYSVIKSHTQSIYDIHKNSEHEKKWDRIGYSG
jgi:predicted transcriptional regulator